MVDTEAFRESFSLEEQERLAPFFTSVDEPVFALRLPQEVSGALFSRYSRTSKSLRRVFLDEFSGQSSLSDAASSPTDDRALEKAREFYDRVLVGYGDDSVAQLGGAHVACERVSNVAAKLLEEGRVGISFLEKSTRYVRFDQKGADGEYLFHKEARLMESPHRQAYLASMESLFGAYAAQIDPMIDFIKRSLPIENVPLRHPKNGEPLSFSEAQRDPELGEWARRAYMATVRAHACDVMRSYLPAATLTNVGIYGTGQALEYLLTRLYSQELAEGQDLAAGIRASLRQVIPSFVKRAGRSEYLVGLGRAARELTGQMEPTPGAVFSEGKSRQSSASPPAAVTLVDWDESAELKILAALLYPHVSAPLGELRQRVKAMSPEDRRLVLQTFASRRENRRDKPGRALESVSYTFDIVANLGIYRDLQRHRLLTQERQLFTAAHGWETPPEIEEIGFGARFTECMERAGEVAERIRRTLPLEAQYAVPFAYRVRWYMKMNLREAVHMIELRSMPQGHPDYRSLVQEMWRKIEEVHPTLGVWARFLNRETYRLGRLQSELRSEYKRSLMALG